MPAKFSVTDETRDSRTQQVFQSKHASVSERYTYYIVPSGTATASIFTGAGFLHAIVVQSSAAASILGINDNADSASAAAIGNTVSAVCYHSGLIRGSYTINAIINNGLNYRLSAADHNGGVILVYSTGS